MRLSAIYPAAVATAVLAGCAGPPPAAPDPSGQANADMNRVLTALASMNPKPIETLTPDEARQQPTAAMAAIAVQQQTTGSAAPLPVASVQDITVPGAAGPLPARIYNPGTGQHPPLPVIVYFGGGGWVIANNLDTYDASARALATGTTAIVVSVLYRHGPETRFPGAHDDAIAAYRWAVSNAARLGGDPARIALAGESAGGSLALATAIYARDNHWPMPKAELLIYPVAGTGTDTPSAREYRNAKPLNTAMLPWFLRYYGTGNTDALKDPRLDPVETADLHGLPPTTVVLAQIDPLRSGGEMLADKMRSTGDDVAVRVFPGVTHEFFGMGSVVAEAKGAEDYATQHLVAQLGPYVPQAMPQPSRARRPVRR